MLLEEGANVNRPIDDGWTALHLAVIISNAKLIKVRCTFTPSPPWQNLSIDRQILLEYGADINQAKEDGWTALHLAAKYTDAEIVEVGNAVTPFVTSLATTVYRLSDPA